MNKRAQTVGVVTGLVFGIATLIVAVIVALVIISNVSTISSDIAADLPATPVVNESSLTVQLAYLNETGYTLAKSTETGFSSPVITAIWNVSASGNYNITIGVGNASVTSAGVVTNTTATYDGMENVSISYTYNYHATTDAVTRMSGNVTRGIDNISGKIPTVLLIAAIILILGILAVLVGVWQKMRVGGSSL